MSKAKGLFFLLPMISALIGLLSCMYLLHNDWTGSQGARGNKPGYDGPGPRDIHVLLCTQDSDLRPFAVTIRSASAAAAEPERLVFHVATHADEASEVEELLLRHLQGFRVLFHKNAALERKLKSTGVPRSSDLFHFFLHRIWPEATSQVKVILLEPGVVVLGDLAELWDHPTHDMVAAVTQSKPPASLWELIGLEDYWYLERGFRPPSNTSSVISRGIVVSDVSALKMQLASFSPEMSFTRLLQEAPTETAAGKVWLAWFLVLGERYGKLPESWNCDGLGAESMSREDVQKLASRNYDTGKLLEAIDARPTHSDEDNLSVFIQPRVSVCSLSAKLLRWSGGPKPWKPDYDERQGEREKALQQARALLEKQRAWSEVTGTLAPLPPAAASFCAAPKVGGQSSQHGLGWTWHIQIDCGRSHQVAFVDCRAIWDSYIDEDEACELKGTHVWDEDERRWTENLQNDLLALEQAAKSTTTAAPSTSRVFMRINPSVIGKKPSTAKPSLGQLALTTTPKPKRDKKSKPLVPPPPALLRSNNWDEVTERLGRLSIKQLQVALAVIKVRSEGLSKGELTKLLVGHLKQREMEKFRS